MIGQGVPAAGQAQGVAVAQELERAAPQELATDRVQCRRRAAGGLAAVGEDD